MPSCVFVISYGRNWLFFFCISCFLFLPHCTVCFIYAMLGTLAPIQSIPFRYLPFNQLGDMHRYPEKKFTSPSLKNSGKAKQSRWVHLNYWSSRTILTSRIGNSCFYSYLLKAEQAGGRARGGLPNKASLAVQMRSENSPSENEMRWVFYV